MPRGQVHHGEVVLRVGPCLVQPQPAAGGARGQLAEVILVLVASYVSHWNSSTGFTEAFLFLALGKLAAATGHLAGAKAFSVLASEAAIVSETLAMKAAQTIVNDVT